MSRAESTPSVSARAMPVPRYDPLGRRWVLLAPERARRGVPPAPADTPDPAPCDFCPGREARTPPETQATRAGNSDPDTPGWGVRAFPNLYPFAPFHEVVVLTPDHEARFEDLPASDRAAALEVVRSRLAAAPGEARMAAMNRGRQAGASRSHEHAQVFGLEVVPPTLQREAESFSAGGDCPLCGIDPTGEHVVEDGGIRLLANPVPLTAHEVLLIPPCAPRFEDVANGAVAEVGEVLGSALGRLRNQFGDGVPLNVVLHTAPGGADGFHWHIHIYPRTATWGALEVGGELPIVAADPPESARLLRR